MIHPHNPASPSPPLPGGGGSAREGPGTRAQDFCNEQAQLKRPLAARPPVLPADRSRHEPLCAGARRRFEMACGLSSAYPHENADIIYNYPHGLQLSTEPASGVRGAR